MEKERKKSFNEICLEFQDNILKVFNEEENIPFLLKYYLMKDIWVSIEQGKAQMEMEARSNMPLEPIEKTINFEETAEDENEN